MENEKKTISQKLRRNAKLLEKIAEWFDNYEEYRNATIAAKDEGSNPPFPPPPPPGDDLDGE